MKTLKTIFTTPTLRKRLLSIAAIASILSLYSIYTFIYLLKTFRWQFNPFTRLLYWNQNGFPVVFPLITLVLTLILVFAAMVKNAKAAKLDDRNFTYSSSGVHGTAGWATKEQLSDFANVAPLEKCSGNVYGKFSAGDSTAECLETKPKHRYNHNSAAFGAAGSGKTTCFVKMLIAQACKRLESVIITDPKGELYEEFAEALREAGYVIRRFDLKNPALSDGWNCIQEVLNAKGKVDDVNVSIFCDTVIKNTTDARNHNASGSVFEDGPRMLLKACVLYVLNSNRFGGPDQPPKSLASAYDLVIDYSEDELAEVFDRPDCCKEARRAYNAFVTTSQNLRGNLQFGLASRLELLQTNEPLRTIISRNDIDLTLPGKKPCAYFLIMTDQHQSFKCFSSLFFSFMFIKLVEFADRQKGRHCPVPVNLICDEIANIGTIPNLSQSVSTIRSRDIYFHMVLQDLPQLERTYPESAASILSNCAFHLGLGFNDPETAKFFSERSGEATVVSKTEHHPVREPLLNLGHQHSTGDGRRYVLTMDELERLPPDEMVLIAQGHNAAHLYKVPYFLHPIANHLKKIDTEHAPSIQDTARRNHIKRMEEERVRLFDEWRKGGCKGPRPPVFPLGEIEDGLHSIEEYRALAYGSGKVSSGPVVWTSVAPPPRDAEKEQDRKPAAAEEKQKQSAKQKNDAAGKDAPPAEKKPAEKPEEKSKEQGRGEAKALPEQSAAQSGTEPEPGADAEPSKKKEHVMAILQRANPVAPSASVAQGLRRSNKRLPQEGSQEKP